jgi:hypothetical protein
MRDRSTKVLLVIIAIALWGLFFRLAPTGISRVEAAPQMADVPVAITYGDGFVFVVTQRGCLERFNGRTDLWIANTRITSCR